MRAAVAPGPVAGDDASDALGVSVTAAAVWIAMTADRRRDIDVLFVVGMLVWAVGFAVEVVTDAQESRFRARPQNNGAFIDIGLRSWSQHSDYFGEITMWVGIAVAAVGSFTGWQNVGLLSPVFVIVFLTRVSGIPMLRAKTERRWGDDPACRAYVRRMSVLVPLPPGRG